MTDFNEVHGWASLSGYKTFKFHLSGENRKVEEKILKFSALEIIDQQVPANTYVKGLRFNAFAVAHIRVSPMTVVWNRKRLSSQRRHMFVLVNKGTVQLRGDATTAIAPEGGVGVVFSGSSSAVIEITSDTEMAFFSFDQNEIRPLAFSSAEVGNIRTDSPIFRAAYAYICGVVDSPDDQDVGSSQVLRELTREVARALALEASSVAPVMDTVAHARQVIERRYRAIAFTPGDVADEIGLSRRSLERACADQDISLADELRARRTSHARHLLPERPHLPLSEIASLSGFSSVEVMRRAFWRFYGESPSTIRKNPVATAESDALHSAD
ncbi:AraC-like DNA-binding protein [Arthrobacter stackebrandtii]|uniref:AraC-like DNA-binding protein n=1 Tax=Arthrobacter stackebrandtii TaxID=272161 RepID=A0ABS4YU82_9MICC|nr:helix-turn-helix domain-containing protein [Arthrobacter stackebrandtii]MBP2411508.1 AraC-like DNA-binding protein [Arthrobacter stackebrandtii]PYH00220.1 hypothetical protein CVV67_10670 [Arthrobacter stackebrandtii]